MILSTAILTLVNNETSASLRTTSIALILLLVVQVLLGAAAVLQELPAWIVTAHLVSATTLIGLLTFVSIRITRSNSERPASFQPMFWLPIAAATATALVIAAGGYTSSSYAGVACPEWPLCGNQIIPVGDQGHRPAIHMIHRVLAAVASLLVLLTAWRLRKVRDEFPEAARLGIVASHLVIVEFWVGAANAMSLTNEIVTAIHSFVAQWVWIVTLAIVVTVLAPNKTRTQFRTSPEP
jgi:heme A synthase